MNQEPNESSPGASAGPSQRWSSRIRFAFIAVCYLAAAYMLIPFVWSRYFAWHPALRDAPGVTNTSDGHPGDPINIALIGSEEDLVSILRDGGWYPADALSLKADLKIAADTVLSRPYKDAPVSNLYLWGRKEDKAFEQPVGNNPRQRHHVRFWRGAEVDGQGRPLWFGAATFDKSVGLSETTGQITHHIDSDVDKERDHLLGDLKQSGRLADLRFVDDFHDVHDGVNGGGDRWHTDGRLPVGTIAARSRGKTNSRENSSASPQSTAPQSTAPKSSSPQSTP